MIDAQPVSQRVLLSEFIGYGLVSAVALVTDITVLRALVEDAGWHYLIASALAFTTGAGVAYVLSVRFVFRFRRMRNPSLELVSFVALGLVGLLVNAAVMSVGISVIGMGLVTAKLLAAGCTFGTNFALRRQLLFSSSRAC